MAILDGMHSSNSMSGLSASRRANSVGEEDVHIWVGVHHYCQLIDSQVTRVVGEGDKGERLDGEEGDAPGEEILQHRLRPQMEQGRYG